MRRARNDFPWWVRALQQVPPRRHVQSLSIQKSSSISLFSAKKPEVDLKVPFSFLKNAVIFINTKAGLLKINLKGFFDFFDLKYLKIFEILIFSEKEIDSPLSYNCNLYLKKIIQIFEVNNYNFIYLEVSCSASIDFSLEISKYYFLLKKRKRTRC
jgi:hypothetical protein